MFSGFMVNTWTVATIVAVIAGVVGFFVVLRGSAFPAHAIPKGAFAGAAGASLLGINTLIGLGVFSLLAALGIGRLSRRGRSDVVTALALVLMLALGAAFLSRSGQYEPEIYSLLFGEILGVSTTQIVPVAVLGVVCLAAVVALYRPLMLSSVVPEVAEAKGIRSYRMQMVFLTVVAAATTVTVPVVIALATVWGAIALSYHSNWPAGFFVGAFGAVCYGLGRGCAALRRRGAGQQSSAIAAATS